MRVDDFDFELPEERIALRPAPQRDGARLLCVGAGGGLKDRTIRDLPGLLQPGDVLVLNDTSVIPAALTGTRSRDGHVAKISVNLHKRLDRASWAAFARPAKRLKPGDEIVFGGADSAAEGEALSAQVTSKGEGGEVTLDFDRAGADLDNAIQARGAMPLPPYIAARRPADARDRSDYQTVYAREDGAVAAPTAGLHFTDDLLQQLAENGISRQFVTLHVGAGTFLPVKAEDTDDHTMHFEWGEVSPETAEALNAARAGGGRIIAVGTTSLRLLESAVDEVGRIHPFRGETDIFITPGVTVRSADLLLTNFHLPKSTLFMLVSAFSGLETMRAAYAHAIESGYRFYSYGDACLLENCSLG